MGVKMNMFYLYFWTIYQRNSGDRNFELFNTFLDFFTYLYDIIEFGWLAFLLIDQWPIVSKVADLYTAMGLACLLSAHRTPPTRKVNQTVVCKYIILLHLEVI